MLPHHTQPNPPLLKLSFLPLSSVFPPPFIHLFLFESPTLFTLYFIFSLLLQYILSFVIRFFFSDSTPLKITSHAFVNRLAF